MYKANVYSNGSIRCQSQRNVYTNDGSLHIATRVTMMGVFSSFGDVPVLRVSEFETKYAAKCSLPEDGIPKFRIQYLELL